MKNTFFAFLPRAEVLLHTVVGKNNFSLLPPNKIGIGGRGGGRSDLPECNISKPLRHRSDEKKLGKKIEGTLQTTTKLSI